MKATLAAGGVFGVSTLLLGPPGVMVLEFVSGLGLVPKLPPDSVWPLAISISNVGALLIIPASLLLRYTRPALVGWAHAGATALLSIIATLIFAVVVAR